MIKYVRFTHFLIAFPTLLFIFQAALSNTGLPKVQVASGVSSDEQPEVDISDEEFLQFDTSKFPVIVTLTKVTNRLESLALILRKAEHILKLKATCFTLLFFLSFFKVNHFSLGNVTGWQPICCGCHFRRRISDEFSYLCFC